MAAGSCPQLFTVVAGEGWVSVGDDERRAVRAGDTVRWDVDEWHEAGTNSGMTAIVIEHNIGGPVKELDIAGP